MAGDEHGAIGDGVRGELRTNLGQSPISCQLAVDNLLRAAALPIAASTCSATAYEPAPSSRAAPPSVAASQAAAFPIASAASVPA